ncbi:MAG: hypothetical protein K2M83_01805 [Muribaculaceae bacterium]|nr:hypothetical protein [Muribaculaceae bacterium]
MQIPVTEQPGNEVFRYRYLAEGHRGYRPAKDKADMERAFNESPKEGKTVALPPVNQLAVMISKSALGKELTDYGCEVTNALSVRNGLISYPRLPVHFLSVSTVISP